MGRIARATATGLASISLVVLAAGGALAAPPPSPVIISVADVAIAADTNFQGACLWTIAVHAVKAGGRAWVGVTAQATTAGDGAMTFAPGRPGHFTREVVLRMPSGASQLTFTAGLWNRGGELASAQPITPTRSTTC